MWLEHNLHKKSCRACIGHKLVCVMDGVQVSKRKSRETKEKLGPKQKKVRMEVEPELVLDGS